MGIREIIGLTLSSIVALGVVVLIFTQTFQIMRDIFYINRFKKLCTVKTQGVVTKFSLSRYKGGKYKSRDGKATYEFDTESGVRKGRDKFAGLNTVTSPKVGDSVKLRYNPADTRAVYGYYSARRLRIQIFYLADFLIFDLLIIGAVVLIAFKILN